MPRRCAFLTTDDLSGFVTYDHLAVPPLEARGWTVDEVPWRAAADWGDWDVVVIRSPWDYQDDPEGFLRVLSEIEAATRLENRLDVVRWNLDKRYLADLERAGVAIVPSRWLDRPAAGELDALLAADLFAADLFAADLFTAFAADEIVVKPTVSANADGTHRLRRGDGAARERAVAELAGRSLVAQPFVPAVVDDGEYSLFAFAGAHSHAVRKVPARGDFRVQEEHGAEILAVDATADQRAAAATVLAAATAHLGLSLLYARVDLVRLPDAGWALMELELIEPSLYFPYDDASAERFAAALDAAVPG